MGSIKLLDEALASQIAAGEVVERPASVAKELLENAVDAGASRIEVYASQGGVERLCVVDDGAGMAPEDASLCFSRHATSKLSAIEQLRHLGTYGFRGEALAAIASVARVRLLTRPRGSEVAYEVQVEGGRVAHVGEGAGPEGTRVDVRDLFFNVPARRKFLKTARTEAGRVEAVVRDFGLALPALALRFDGDGRKALDLPAAEEGAPLDDPRRIERAALCLCGQAQAGALREHLLPIDEQTDLLRVKGYLVAPLETRRDTAGIHLTVNGRPVADRGLSSALKLAYRPLLEVGRHPICALDIELASELVDVNVHPRKAEVRFEDPRRVHGHLIRVVSEFLARAPWRKRGPSKTYRLGGNQPGLGLSGPSTSGPVPEGEDPAAVHRARVREALARFQARVQGRRGGEAGYDRGGRPSSRQGAQASRPEGKVLGRVAGSWLIGADDSGLIVVDRAGAAERLAELEMRAALSAGRLEGQPMLFPLRFDLTPIEAEALQAVSLDDEGRPGAGLQRYGLDIEFFGESVGLCRAVPGALDAGRAEEIARSALELVSEGRPGVGSEGFEAELGRRLAAFARPVTDDAILLRQVLELEEEQRRAVMRRLGPDDLAALLAQGPSPAGGLAEAAPVAESADVPPRL